MHLRVSHIVATTTLTRLVEVVYPEGGPVIELAYDGLNRCVRTRVNGAGVVHIYDGLQRIQDRDERTGDLHTFATLASCRAPKQPR